MPHEHFKSFLLGSGKGDTVGAPTGQRLDNSKGASEVPIVGTNHFLKKEKSVGSDLHHSCRGQIYTNLWSLSTVQHLPYYPLSSGYA